MCVFVCVCVFVYLFCFQYISVCQNSQRETASVFLETFPVLFLCDKPVAKVRPSSVSKTSFACFLDGHKTDVPLYQLLTGCKSHHKAAHCLAGYNSCHDAAQLLTGCNSCIGVDFWC